MIAYQPIAPRRLAARGCTTQTEPMIAPNLDEALATGPDLSHAKAWSAVGSMALCVAMLIASEFMPVSLLTPIAHDLGATEGTAGQAISISGLFAVITSLLITPLAGRLDRRRVLLALTGAMLASLVLIAMAPSFAVLMIARALLGLTIGGFWALSTATVMRLVPAASVPKALGVLYTGNALATTFAAPIGSYLGSVIGWRGVFWALVPIVVVNLAWQWVSLPALPSQRATPLRQLLSLLKQRPVRLGLASVMLTFAGAFATFTYFRPFLERVTHVTVSQLSLLLLGLGCAGFLGTYGASQHAGRRLWILLRGLPLALAAVTLAMLGLGEHLWPVAATMIAWGALNSAIPVAWSTWVSTAFRDDPESGGGLLVAAIQLAILLGAALGGLLLDHVSIAATFIAGAAMLVAASVLAGQVRRE